LSKKPPYRNQQTLSKIAKFLFVAVIVQNVWVDFMPGMEEGRGETFRVTRLFDLMDESGSL
jgi:hypothetical protein